MTFQSKYENKFAQCRSQFKMKLKNRLFDKALPKIISWS